MAIAFAALSPHLSLSPFPSPSPLPSSASSSVPVLLIHRSVLSRSCLRGSSACLSSQALRTGGEELPDEDSVEFEKKDTDIHNKKKNTKKKKLRPSFCDQTLERWSVKISSRRSSFPWQNQKIQPSQGLSAPGTPVYRSLGNYGAADLDSRDQIKNFDEERRRTSLDLIVEKLGGSVVDKCSDSGVSDGSLERSVDEIPPNHGRSIPFRKRSISAPWDHGAEHGQKHIHSGFVNETLMKNFEFGGEDERHKWTSVDAKRRGCSDQNKTSLNFGDNSGVSVEGGFHVLSTDKTSQTSSVGGASFRDHGIDPLEADTDPKVAFQLPIRDYDLNENGGKSRVSVIVDKLKDSMGSSAPKINVCASFGKSASKHGSNPGNNVVKLVSPVLLPWERETDSKEGEQLHRSNTELAERAIPEPELRRLRDAALRMKERMTVGPAGVTEAVVKNIHEKWKEAEVVKLRFEGTPSLNMKRTHEILEKLTGGVLVSRNKEYIVFYRGNDFVTSSVMEVLSEKQKLASIHQDEEEIARLRASTSIVAHVKSPKGQLVAGTLAETLEAKSRWGNPFSAEEREMLKKDMVLAKHASLVRYLERKLVFAKIKVRKAEKALSKVQEFLKPADLPIDLETVSDEERALFRNIGLKMRGALLLGRRGVFDGTVENMHLNWKHRELVKILVKGKSFAQVKHYAISLEAESGGVLISLDKTTKGYAIIIYRGKNYQRPPTLRPKNLLTRRQALARSIELQRREALIHHISSLQEKIQILTSQLEQMEDDKGPGEKDLDLPVDLFSDDDVEDEGEEAYLETYSSGAEEEEDVFR
nr:PREDICTED: CRM-domain containing factor CFM3A, chloroplastic/mitochondrial isoform X3 [Musa acuminata subsp. malaccensis]